MKLIFLLLAYLSASTYAWEPRPCNSMMDFPQPCKLQLSGIDVTISSDGLVAYEYNLKKIKVKVTLPEYFGFEVVRHLELRDGVMYFNIEITDMDAGSSKLFAIEQKSGELIWESGIPAFNSSQLLLVNGAVYVGGIGYVAKLDILTGKHVWKIGSLYERETQAFNGFKKPYVMGENIVFPESKVSTAKYKGERTIIVNDRTGKLVSK